MKKLIFIITGLLMVPMITLAQSGDHNRSVNDILTEIQNTQEVESNKDIDCDEVTNEQWEELGDAVMGVMHPDEEQHELMDEMMGGEGSNSLAAMHMAMGQQYLGCGNAGWGMMGGYGGGMGIMGGSWRNNWNNNYRPMMYTGNWGNAMGWGFSYGLPPLFNLVIWGFAIFGVVALIRSFTGKKK